MTCPISEIELPWTRQQLSVPREDGTLFSSPSLHEATELAACNHVSLTNESYDVQGRSLERLRRWTRESACRAARKYTSELTGTTIPEVDFDLLFVAGHQPSLFHPGVWSKNFSIGQLAMHTNGVGLNLVVDNDIMSWTRIRVPCGNREAPSVEMIEFDEDRSPRPWEDASVVNEELFRSFGDRLTAAMQRWNLNPVVTQMWPNAVTHMLRSPRLTDCLTAARSRLERRWGLGNLELLISHLCRLDPFLWFTAHILAHLPRFRDIHNRVLLEYRQINRIRSRTHPVPDLKEAGDWLEAPFWIWRTGDLKRSRVFAKQVGHEVRLSDGTHTFAKLPLTADGEACRAVDVLRDLSAGKIKLRTRALTTTLFTRLCLSDLFVHGIGGAKYDEITDHIIARFFRVTPPGFLTLSATLDLPFAKPFVVETDDHTRLQDLLRELKYNSQRHLTAGTNGNADKLMAQKARLVSEQKSVMTNSVSRRIRRKRSRSNFQRFRQFQELNEQLATFTQPQRQRIEDERQMVVSQLHANSILNDREFSFCLYPIESIQSFMNGIWDMSAVAHKPGHFQKTASDD